MSRRRWVLAATMLIVLFGLLGWQKHRERMMNICLAQGRTWNGPLSRCEAPRIGPILRRSLERT